MDVEKCSPFLDFGKVPPNKTFASGDGDEPRFFLDSDFENQINYTHALSTFETFVFCRIIHKSRL
jgi:hypothetical protein